LIMESFKDTIFKFLRLENLIDSLTGFVESKIELLKIEIREEVAKVLANALMIFIVALLGLIFLLFVSVGLANYLNTIFDQTHVGYWMVSGIYGIPCLIFVVFRKQIGHKIEARLIEFIKRKNHRHGTTGNAGSGEEKAS
jgi:uncharacterized membrane protein YqjE